MERCTVRKFRDDPSWNNGPAEIWIARLKTSAGTWAVQLSEDDVNRLVLNEEGV